MLEARPPNRPQEVELLPHVTPVLSRYVAQGWQLVIVSNQGGVASGFFSEAQARAVQQRVIELLGLPVAASYLCPHAPEGIVSEYAVDCPNRKPRPGFILAALERFGACAGACLFVGDSITDLQAAQAAGVPYRWADRFFGRPIDRGLHTRDGRWVRIRTAQADDLEALGGDSAKGVQPGQVLVAAIGGQIVGWLTVIREVEGRGDDWSVCVDPAYRGIGIKALLRNVSLENEAFETRPPQL